MATRTSDKYVYKSLEAADLHAFRLLSLEPGSGPEVRVQLFSSSLIDHPTYEALSYVWGTDYGDHHIECGGGRSIPVTGNCKDALIRLRGSEPRILWVDAICIDQNSIEERNQQVRRMHGIFKNAQQVLIWFGIGTSTTESILGLKVIRILNAHIQNAKATGWDIRHRDPEWKKICEAPEVDLSLLEIAKVSWWDRVWVTQEIALSAKATVIYGDQELDWSEFGALSAWMARDGAPTNGCPGWRSLITCVLHKETIRLMKESISLPTALLFTTANEASDPRDRVFGIAGLLRRDSQVDVDYTQTIEEFCISTATKLLEVAKCVDDLRPWDFGEHEEIYVGLSRQLPSWVRDFSLLRQLHPSHMLNANSSRGVPLVYKVRDRVLELLGKVIDVVKTCRPILPVRSYPEHFFPAIRAWAELALHNQSYRTGEDSFDVFLRLLVFNGLADYSGNNKSFSRTQFRRWYSLIKDDPLETANMISQDPLASRFTSSTPFLNGMRLCATKKEFLAVVPPYTKPGDKVVLLAGAKLPYILPSDRQCKFR